MLGSSDTLSSITKWTFDEYISLAEQNGGSLLGYTITKYDFIVTLASTEFVDWDTGESYFDSENFIAMLELAADLPDDEFDPYVVSTYELIDSGQQLLSYGFSNNTYGMIEYCLYYGDDVQILGFPSTENGGSLIYPLLNLGMTSASEHKDGVWTFLRQFLMEDYQINVGHYAYPLLQSALDYWDQDAINNIADGGIEYNYVDGGQEYTVTIDNTSFVDASQRLIDSVTGVYSYDNSVVQIVYEESMSFFNGDKTASNVASIISNRVQTYVNEQR